MEILAVCLSAIAIAFSAFTWLSSREADKRDLFLSHYQALNHSEMRRGRLILYSIRCIEDVERLRREHPDKYDLALGAMSGLDVLAVYVEHGFVPRGLVLEELGHVLARCEPGARAIAMERAEELGYASFPSMRRLAQEAQTWMAQHAKADRWRLPSGLAPSE